MVVTAQDRIKPHLCKRRFYLHYARVRTRQDLPLRCDIHFSIEFKPAAAFWTEVHIFARNDLNTDGVNEA